jgi:hypothetical protein
MYPRVKTSAETHWIKSWLTVLEPTEERTPLPVTSVPLMELLARMELWGGLTLMLAQSKAVREFQLLPALAATGLAAAMASPKSSVTEPL